MSRKKIVDWSTIGVRTVFSMAFLNCNFFQILEHYITFFCKRILYNMVERFCTRITWLKKQSRQCSSLNIIYSKISSLLEIDFIGLFWIINLPIQILLEEYLPQYNSNVPNWILLILGPLYNLDHLKKNSEKFAGKFKQK